MVFALPIGYENFRTLVEKKMNFVDKTALVAAIMDDETTQIPVILRPRRFGKTLNLSMLHHFLAPEVNGKATAGLFDGLKIMQMGEPYSQQQGKYPVIFITLKGIKQSDHKMACASLRNLMSDVYSEHRYLLSSPQLQDENKKFYEAILKQEGSDTFL